MSDRDHEAVLALGPIDQAMWEPVDAAGPQTVLVHGPAFWRFSDLVNGAAQSRTEALLDVAAPLAIPAPGLTALGDRFGMEVNDPSDHPKD